MFQHCNYVHESGQRDKSNLCFGLCIHGAAKQATFLILITQYYVSEIIIVFSCNKQDPLESSGLVSLNTVK